VRVYSYTVVRCTDGWRARVTVGRIVVAKFVAPSRAEALERIWRAIDSGVACA
jgi:hypothetical protein